MIPFSFTLHFFLRIIGIFSHIFVSVLVVIPKTMFRCVLIPPLFGIYKLQLEKRLTIHYGAIDYCMKITALSLSVHSGGEW